MKTSIITNATYSEYNFKKWFNLSFKIALYIFRILQRSNYGYIYTVSILYLIHTNLYVYKHILLFKYANNFVKHTEICKRHKVNREVVLHHHFGQNERFMSWKNTVS